MPTKKQKTDPQSQTPTTAPKRIFDVARPGALPPADPTGRPGIVTNRVVLQDPMMVAQSTSLLPHKDSSADTPIKPSPKLVIRPIVEEAAASDNTVKVSDVSDADPTKLQIHFDSDADGVIEKDETARNSSVAVTPAKVEPAEEPASPAATTSSVPNESQSPDDKDADGSGESEINKLDKEAAALEADAKAQDEIDTLVDEKTYFLPINSLEQRRSRHVFIFGTIVIVLLALVWLDIAMDAGFITIPGVHSLTHIFTK